MHYAVQDILLVIPTAKEAAGFLNFSDSSLSSPGKVSRGLFGNKNVHVLITGVGSVDTINRLSLLAEKGFLWKLILHAGIAGSFSRKYPPGSAVIVERDCFGDTGVFYDKRFFNLFDKKLSEPDAWPYRNGWLHLPRAPEWAEALALPAVRAVTVAAINNPVLQASVKQEQYDIETMEGAAVALFCLSRNIPLLHLRAISNYAHQPDSNAWDFGPALQKLHDIVSRFMELFTE